MNSTPLIDNLKPDWRLLVPAIHADLRAYSRAKFRADLTAAVTVTLVSVPQILGFALVLGLPPAMVLTCAIVGAFVSALFFSSKLLIFGVTNSVTLLVASAIHHGRPTALNPAQLAVLLAGLIGVLQIGGALLRLGQVTQFISRSVIIAYSSATGVLLVLSQLPNLFGLRPARGLPLWEQLWTHAQQIAALNFDVAAPVTAILALLIYLLIRAVRPSWPDVLIGLTLCTLAFWFVPGLENLGVKTLASQITLDATLPGYARVPFSPDDLPVLGTVLSTALAIALLGVMEAVSLAKNLALKHGEPIDPNREVMALGLGNLANSFFGSIPGSASFVRSAVNAQSGARTQVAGLVAALCLLAALLSCSPFLNRIPIPALAASLVLIGLRMIDTAQIDIAARATGSDAAVLVVTFAAALTMSLNNAIYTGVGLSLALALRKASTPSLVEYTFNDSQQLTQLDDKEARVHPQIAIIHVEGELFFGAADLFQEHVRRQVEQEDLRVIILRLKSARHLDATTVFALRGLQDWLRNTGRHLLVSGAHGDVLRVFKRSRLLEHIGRENVFPAELNRNLATKKALQRAQHLLGTREADVRIYCDQPVGAA